MPNMKTKQYAELCKETDVRDLDIDDQRLTEIAQSASVLHFVLGNKEAN